MTLRDVVPSMDLRARTLKEGAGPNVGPALRIEVVRAGGEELRSPGSLEAAVGSSGSEGFAGRPRTEGRSATDDLTESGLGIAWRVALALKPTLVAVRADSGPRWETQAWAAGFSATCVQAMRHRSPGVRPRAQLARLAKLWQSQRILPSNYAPTRRSLTSSCQASPTLAKMLPKFCKLLPTCQYAAKGSPNVAECLPP